MKYIKPIFFWIALTLSFNMYGQSSNLGNWLIYFGNKKINNSWNWHHEIQHRNYDVIGDLEQLLIRTGIGFNLTENNNNLLLGYGFIHSQNYADNNEDKIEVNEHRVYQQFITRQSFGRVNIQHRYRFEQRWVEDQDLRLRFRYFLSINVPISHKQMTDDTWYASAYNEIFINDEQTLFDRNRIYIGIGYKLNSIAKFELGHMNQILNGLHRDQINLIAFLNF